MGKPCLVLSALVACVGLNAACGSAPATDFYQSTTGVAVGVGGTTSTTGGSPSTEAGTTSVGMAGTTSGPSGGQSAAAGTTSIMGNPNAPCSPAKDVSGGMSGDFGTTGGACIRVTSDITGWGCSNFDGRIVKVNGQTVMCAEEPLPAKIDGAYYFDISPGTFDYASFYWF